MPSVTGAVPFGLHKVTFEILSSEHQQALERAWHERDLRLCQTCGADQQIAHLLTCAACGNNRIRRIYYCSRECQKRDWKQHKRICGPDHGGPECFGVPRGHQLELKSERATWKWMEAMRVAVVWATASAFRRSAFDDGQARCLNFHFESVSSRDKDSSYHLVRMHYGPLTAQMRGSMGIQLENEQYRFYLATLDRRLQIAGMLPPDSQIKFEEHDNNTTSIQIFPWVLSHVAFFKVDDPEIVHVLLQTFTAVFLDYQARVQDNGVLDRFVVPPFKEEWVMEGFWDWELLMRNVIAFDPNGPPKQGDNARVDSEIS